MSSQRYDIYIYIFIVIFDDLKFHDFVGDCNFQSGVIFIGCKRGRASGAF